MTLALYEPRGAARELFHCRDTEILVEGPAGCVAGETRLFNPITGESPTFEELCLSGSRPWVQTIHGPEHAKAPFLKGHADLYSVCVGDRRARLTGDHLLLSRDRGWVRVFHLAVGEYVAVSGVSFPAPSTLGTFPSASQPSAAHWSRIPQGCRERYSGYSHQRDGQPLIAPIAAQASPPSQADAFSYTRADLHSDGLGDERGHIFHPPASRRPSTQDCSLRSGGISGGGSGGRLSLDECGERRNETCGSFRLWTGPERNTPATAALDHPIHFASSSPDKVQWVQVDCIELSQRNQPYYDLTVPQAQHYLAEGIWHHNTGKTLGVLEKIFGCMVKYPNARALILRKTRASMTESVLVTLEQRVIPTNRSLYPEVGGIQRGNRHSYEFPNGSSIVVGGMDNPNRIMSTEYDMIGVFEGTELIEQEYEPLVTRLGRNNKMPYSQIIVDVNPGGTTHWLNQRANKGHMTRLLSRHTDNPMLFNKGQWTEIGSKYMAVLNRLSGTRRARLLEGRWATAEGVVYPDFDPLIHVIPKFEIPKEWRRIRSIDFGYTNPFVCGWYGIDPDGRLFKYRELYGTGRLVEDWAKDILTLSGDERYEVTISDHDAEDRATLTRHGVSTMAAFKGVTPGIQAVEARLRPAGDGKPRYFQMKDILVSRDEKLAASYKPTCSEQEWESYVWPKSIEGKPIKEEPVKENDHGMDELRYAVAYVDNIQFAPASVKISNGTPQPAKVPIFVSVNNGRGGWH